MTSPTRSSRTSGRAGRRPTRWRTTRAAAPPRRRAAAPAVAVTVDDVTDPLEPHLRTSGAKADPMADHLGVLHCGDECGRAEEDVFGDRRGGRPAPRPHVVGATEHDIAAAGDDVGGSVAGYRLAEPP